MSMATGRDVVVLSGVRTAIGKYGGSLKDMPPADLGAAVVREAVGRSGVEPADDCHMGVTAENVAGKWGISREDQDALAVQSHQRAAKATAEGYFKEQILPIELKSRKGTTVFDTDEHIRADASQEAMAKLKPVFNKEGSVTAGSAAGINDAAAAV